MLGSPTYEPDRSRPSLRVGALAIPALASLGAGAIHAAAMGVHNEHRAAVITFAIVAAFQLGWGVIALTSSRLWIAIAGAIGNAALVAGWVMAKTSGIWFVAGLDEKEAVQWADGAAAALAAIAVLGVVVWALRGRPVVTSDISFRAATVPLAIVTVTAMVTAASHSHGAAGHTHGTADVALAAGATAPDGHTHSHGDATASAQPVAFDPTQPIDLGGISGVTPQQQAQAENLLAATLVDLPRWSDYKVAEAQGWHSIHDSITGYEHFINLPMLSDGHVLDPNYPESLVYQVDRATGQKKLVAAMFMAEPGTTLDNVPTLGGKLLQWHIHDNLCFTADEHPVVAGLTNADGNCNPPLVKGTQAPMVHVWITSNVCGPFAALEGIAGGQIKAGETRWCDTAHGEHSHG